MKALSNVGIKEVVYYRGYERIQTGGEKFEEEDESLDLAKKKEMIVRQYEGNIYCKFPDAMNGPESKNEVCDECACTC
jgi:hypothetical protein